MRLDCGIVSEANALRKAKGYADRDTGIWKIEVPVGVKTL